MLNVKGLKTHLNPDSDSFGILTSLFTKQIVEACGAVGCAQVKGEHAAQINCGKTIK